MFATVSHLQSITKLLLVSTKNLPVYYTQGRCSTNEGIYRSIYLEKRSRIFYVLSILTEKIEMMMKQ